MRTVVVLVAAAAGNIGLGMVFGDSGRLVGLIAGLIFGMILIQPGVIRRSSVFLQEVIKEAKNYPSPGGPGRAKRLFIDFFYFLGALVLNAVFWINIPRPVVDFVDPLFSIQTEMWSTFFPIIESHYQQLYGYSGEGRATRISYVYATSYTLAILFGIWRMGSMFRELMPLLVFGYRLEPKRRSLMFFALVVCFLVASVAGGWFSFIGDDIDFFPRVRRISLLTSYMVGDTYWAIWKWLGLLWVFVIMLPLLAANAVLILHWSLFFPKHDEGK